MINYILIASNLREITKIEEDAPDALIEAADFLDKKAVAFFNLSIIFKPIISLPEIFLDQFRAHGRRSKYGCKDDSTIRIINTLERVLNKEIENILVGDVIQIKRSEILKSRNFGKKSLAKLEQILDAHALSLDICLPGWKS